jgi:hypothetical protein
VRGLADRIGLDVLAVSVIVSATVRPSAMAAWVLIQ